MLPPRQGFAAVQRLADRYQRVIGCQYFEHGRKVAALAERGAEAVRRTFQRNRLGERDSDRRDLEKPHRRLQAAVVISAAFGLEGRGGPANRAWFRSRRPLPSI